MHHTEFETPDQTVFLGHLVPEILTWILMFGSVIRYHWSLDTARSAGPGARGVPDYVGDDGDAPRF